MTFLRPNQSQSILVRVEFARAELADLRGYQGLSYATYETDRTARRNVEHAIENAVNAATDIAKILLAVHNTAVPETYRETLLKMAEIGVLSPDEADALSKTAGLRNRLAHRYLDHKWPAVHEFLTTGIDVVAKFLDRCEALAVDGPSDHQS